MYKSTDENPFSKSSQSAGYAEWIALGAVAAGSVAAIVGMANCRKGMHADQASPFESDPESLTAPHGDKLKGAVV